MTVEKSAVAIFVRARRPPPCTLVRVGPPRLARARVGGWSNHMPRPHRCHYNLALRLLAITAGRALAAEIAIVPRWSQLPSPSLQTELPSQRRYPLLILMRRRTSRASMRPHPGERRQREIGGCHRRLMTSRQVYVCRI